MRVFVLGAGGQLGSELVKSLKAGKLDVHGFTHEEMNVMDPAKLFNLAHKRPHFIINCAAFHNVDGCEQAQAHANYINGIGMFNVAQLCEAANATGMYISTDYVFGRIKPVSPKGFIETDPPDPINAYGRSKVIGEMMAQSLDRSYIIRTAGIFGIKTSGKGHTFPEMIINRVKNEEPVWLNKGSYFSPTYAVDLAEAITKIVLNQGVYPPGTYHLVNSGWTNWAEFGLEAINLAGLTCQVELKDHPDDSIRPRVSILQNIKGPELPHWKVALQRYIYQLKKEGRI